MFKLLIKRFIPNSENTTDKIVREKYGIIAGVLGVVSNLFLFILKLIIGTMVNSIAIISDSFNNLSDMGSSVVSAIGIKMSNMRPDKEHPFGHGRIEYISALVVAFMIMLVGVELFKTSFAKILNPEKPVLLLIPMIILVLSIGVKLWMFSYNRYIGKIIDSEVFKATAQDCLNDVIATSAVVISTIIGVYLPFSIDGAIGCIVSVMILFTGFGVAKDTIDMLLGTPPKPETVKEITDIIMKNKMIIGVHDLIIHDYGPGRVMASVHAEVPNDVCIDEAHESIDEIEKYIYKLLDVHIVIHMDPICINDSLRNENMKIVLDAVKAVNPAFNIHDFRMTDGKKNINLIFDLEVPLDMKQAEKEKAIEEIEKRIKKCNEKFSIVMNIDNV